MFNKLSEEIALAIDDTINKYKQEVYNETVKSANADMFSAKLSTTLSLSEWKLILDTIDKNMFKSCSLFNGVDYELRCKLHNKVIDTIKEFNPNLLSELKNYTHNLTVEDKEFAKEILEDLLHYSFYSFVDDIEIKNGIVTIK